MHLKSISSLSDGLQQTIPELRTRCQKCFSPHKTGTTNMPTYMGGSQGSGGALKGTYRSHFHFYMYILSLFKKVLIYFILALYTACLFSFSYSIFKAPIPTNEPTLFRHSSPQKTSESLLFLVLYLKWKFLEYFYR